MSTNVAFCERNEYTSERKGEKAHPFILVHCPVPRQESVKGVIFFFAVLALSRCHQPFIKLGWGFLDQWPAFDVSVSCSSVICMFLCSIFSYG